MKKPEIWKDPYLVNDIKTPKPKFQVSTPSGSEVIDI
jgi:hypothetical protein